MDTNESRIKLAEAIFGADRVDMHHFIGLRVWRDKWTSFDPYTDANDDYAVLEWIRRHHEDDTYGVIGRCFPRCHRWMNYQIGDYARTAMKVLETK